MSVNHHPLLIAIYLPQYHPIPENDAWWGKGFTEWTNVTKARPLYTGHYQPHLPADLGFYDLRVPETRQQQADLATKYGISAFCYYHYWFSGRRILERPFNEVLASGKPDFPFCLCWANTSWTGVWYGVPNKMLIEQTYSGYEDAIRHFYALLPAFLDKRYLRINNKPVFAVYKPMELPERKGFIKLWQKLAVQNGLDGIHFTGFAWDWSWDFSNQGFDAAVCVPPAPLIADASKIDKNLPTIYDYEQIRMKLIPEKIIKDGLYSCLRPNWDNTPRSGARGLVFHGSTPELFRPQISLALDQLKDRSPDSRVLFIKAWNEWAEGNHLEPDQLHGHGYLEVIKSELNRRSWT